MLGKDILVSQSLALCISSAPPSMAAKSFFKRHMKMCRLCGTLVYVHFSCSPRPLSPDDDDDTVKDVVGVAEVIKEAKSSKFQDHLQGKHACKDNIADLQDIGQFLWLGRRQIQRVRTERSLKLWEIKCHHS